VQVDNDMSFNVLSSCSFDESDSSARNPVEFTELLSLSRSRVFGHLLALVQNLADAEDLYQQTALLLWEKLDQFQRGTDFGAWAVTVAHYQALNFLRRQSRRRMLFSDVALARLAAVQLDIKTSELSARSEALSSCLESLPARSKQMLRLRYQGDQSLQQIAEQERRSVGAVYTAISRIRKALMSCIESRVAQEKS
jgi:RNA polymerase sigma-70 factor (ECF subfamily)